MNHRSRPLVVLAVVGALCLPVEVVLADAPPTDDVVELASVNGTSITTADLDAVLIASHRSMSTRRRATYEYRGLLDKLINDELILQQARVLGLDQEPSILEPLEKSRVDNAVGKYVAATYEGPNEISDEAIRDFFDELYWKIELRQISVLSETEATELVEAVRAGAPMDSIAQEVSVDTRRFRGGLHNLKVWADVENELREASVDLNVGQVSEPFRYRESYAFVRVEDRRAVDDADLPVYEGEIRKYLRGAERERAWASFIDELLGRFPVRVDEEVVARVRADSGRMISQEFVVDSDTPVVMVGDSYATEFEFRKTLSHKGMQAALAPFDSLLDAAVRAEKSDLVLREAAQAGGWFDHESVQQAYLEELDQALIEAYLAEAIVADIKFNRDEFREYWEQNPDEFRKAPEVQLGTIMVGTPEEAEEIVARLQDGADFGYLRTQYARPGHDAIEADKWVSPAIFSDEIRVELMRLEVGHSSGAYEVGGGWFVFKLKNRRQGEVRPLEECEMQLRELMFQQKFNTLLDEHLALLKERSDLVLHEEAIEEYFGT